jgi:APA family basic amino acid/polyamine antiporter
MDHSAGASPPGHTHPAPAAGAPADAPHRRRAGSPPATAHAGEPGAVLGLRAAVALIVGIVIGAGIFRTPALVAGLAGDAAWMFAAWVLGGAVSLAGALCYAELSTAYPHAGGDYHFLRRAYGPGVSFLFAWARFSVITTGSIALLAFVFGDYLQAVWPLGPHGSALYAAAAVLVLTAVNLRGIRAGAATQGWLTLLEVAGLLAIVLAGMHLAGAGAPAAAAEAPAANSPSAAGFGMAMVFVLLTYGGWNEAAYLSAELRDGRRNMVRALVLSIVLITVLYLLVTWAYWQGLGLAGMAASQAIAADLLRAALGEAGAAVIAVLVAVAALTSINATMIVGARTGFAVGRDWPALGRLGRWDGARGTPREAMLLQGAAALLLVGVGALAGSGFQAMVEFTAPVFWLFFLLSGLSLFVLRRRAPEAAQPYRVPLYPLLPAVFVAACGCMLWSSLAHVGSQQIGGFNAAWIGIAVLASGLLLRMLLSRLNRRSMK